MIIITKSTMFPYKESEEKQSYLWGGYNEHKQTKENNSNNE